MLSPPSAQGTLDVDRAPEQGARIDARITRLDVELDAPTARGLIALLRPGYPAVADAVKAALAELEDLNRPPF